MSHRANSGVGLLRRGLFFKLPFFWRQRWSEHQIAFIIWLSVLKTRQCLQVLERVILAPVQSQRPAYSYVLCIGHSSFGLFHRVARLKERTE